ncbi:glycosyltransferase family 4 protein [Chitinophagaceae bacterium LWZ2-11]
MDKRARIGLLFSVSEGWIGGSYYFLNIIAAFNTLPEELKPQVIIYSNNDESFKIVQQETNYPYLSYECSVFKLSLFERMINKLSRSILKKNIIWKGVNEEKLPLLFGYYEQMELHKCKKKIYWIPDFQEYYYPQFIGKQETAKRESLHIKLIKQKSNFIFSSDDAQNDFFKIYSPKDCKTSVVKFAVTHPDYASIDIEELRKKYKLKNKYFFTPNQFWPHKNHLTLLKAAKRVKEETGIGIQLVFSGKANPNDPHVQTIHKYIADAGLSEDVVFLGFVDRKEQLCIMKNSLAVVQPSLFEGWSTVVEDAKAMGKFLILSELRVHKEQMLNYKCLFFEADNDVKLSINLINVLEQHPEPVSYNYAQSINTFALQFMNAIKA